MARKQSWKPCRGTEVYDNAIDMIHHLWFDIWRSEDLMQKSKLVYQYLRYERIANGNNRELPSFFYTNEEIEQINNNEKIYKRYIKD